MLDDFMLFIKDHMRSKWIHWNMREGNYGFQAINHRYEVLGGESVNFPDENKIDLADKVKDIYGDKYIQHPRFYNLVQKNTISDKDFLNGKQEAEAFKSKEYVKLHNSTVRKLNIIHTILERVLDRSLLTDSKWKEIYGIKPTGLFELSKDTG